MRLPKAIEEAILATPGIVVTRPKSIMVEFPSPSLDCDEVKEFMPAVRTIAERNGWKCYHTYDSRRSDPGFLDLVMVREVVLFIELKSEKGKPTDAQMAWMFALANAGQFVRLWRPSDWPEIVRTLTQQFIPPEVNHAAPKSAETQPQPTQGPKTFD